MALAEKRRLALDGLQVRDDGTDIAGVKAEFRHIWVARHNTFPQRFFQRLDRITLTESTERRSKFIRTLAASGDGVAHRTVFVQQLLAALEFLRDGRLPRDYHCESCEGSTYRNNASYAGCPPSVARVSPPVASLAHIVAARSASRMCAINCSFVK